ncbi:2TM domain-containing protein [Croceivirga thetidis]|uniref:2TM domain-containing protein n=1 Tax=Croceivirga thetidis TaxID=2721623 RepID=A0ABX1GUY6_9FLAO|nr:2TM domain-containing protein [Croceivirga thetidis]NKI32730.1 2TM domain-containing protein [Croceivirga thetidis]
MKTDNNKYLRAKKRVEEIKSFYRHLKVFVVINGVFYLFKLGVFNSFLPEWVNSEPQFFNWVNMNVVLWGVILVVHFIYIYRNKIPFLKKWEERQIQKIMDREKEETKKYR